MLPMTASRVKKSSQELREFIENNKLDLEGAEQLTKAYEELDAANAVMG